MGELDPLLIDFLKLDGSNANQNIDIGSYDFTTTGDLYASNLTLTNNLELTSDGGTACFGADQDLCIYHDGSNGFIDNNTGDFKLITAGETTVFNESNHGLRVHDNGLVSVVSSVGELWKFHYRRLTSEGNEALYLREAGGVHHVSIGHDSIPDSATATFATAIGNNSLHSLQNGTHNTAIGTNTLHLLTTGTHNMALGDYTMERATSGQDNVAVGDEALLSITTGDDNVGIGKGAYTDLTGNRNIGIGRNAGFESTSANYNVYIGYKAGNTATTADNNTVIGYEAGYLNNNSDCVLIGYQAGYNNASSDRLYINNSSNAYPLIYGEFDNDLIAIGDESNSWIASISEVTTARYLNFASKDQAAGYGIRDMNGGIEVKDSGGSWTDILRANGTTNLTGNWLVATDTQIQFRDTALYINSNDDGHLDITADTIIDLNSNVTISGTLGVDGNTYLNSDVTISANAFITSGNYLFFRDGDIHINSPTDGVMLIEADSVVTIGVAGDVTLGDSVERAIRPNVDLKENLGSATHRFNNAFIGGDITIDGTMSCTGFSSSGTLIGTMWRRKLKPCDCVPVHSYANLRPTGITTPQKSYVAYTTYDFVWYVEIPYGMKAAKVMVFGEDAASAVIVYQSEINDGTTKTNKGSGNINTEIDITDVPWTNTNYLAITVNQASTTTDEIFGGYVDFEVV